MIESKILRTSLREIPLRRCLVMAILNVTPDSFSDGGNFSEPVKALRQVERLLKEGADLIDIGGESTRPGSEQITIRLEMERTIPVIEQIKKRFDVPVSIDTSKSEVAAASIDAGAEIINDVSGLRFDEQMAATAARTKAGLIVMHSRGRFAEMHSLPPVADILPEVVKGLRHSVDAALASGVKIDSIAIDPGFGFGKSFEQNIELLANLDVLTAEFSHLPLLAGISRKSFIGKVLNDVPVGERLAGSLAAAVIAAEKGAKIMRVHDVKETVDALKVVDALREK